MQNIDLFDQYTAQILAQLYAAFPVKQPLDARKLCGHSSIDEYGAVLDDQGARSKHFEVARFRAKRWSWGLSVAAMPAWCAAAILRSAAYQMLPPCR